MADQTQGVIPHLVLENAADALDSYKKALGADEVVRIAAQDGKTIATGGTPSLRPCGEREIGQSLI